MKPPIAYYGAKVTIAQQIVAKFPDHEHYVEPFAGSLAVLLAKRPSRMETVNDLDGEVMAFWRTLRDRPADLERVCALTPHGRAEHAAAYEPVPADHPDRELEVARRVWVRLTQSRGGSMRRSGWRHYMDPNSSPSSTAVRVHGYVARMAAAAERLSRVSLECRPALDVIAAYGKYPGVLLYADPPYLASARTSTEYRHEMPSEDEHRLLAEALMGCKATVVLSGYETPLYADLYGGWHRREIETATGQGGSWSARTEVLWSNRPFPVADGGLFDELVIA